MVICLRQLIPAFATKISLIGVRHILHDIWCKHVFDLFYLWSCWEDYTSYLCWPYGTYFSINSTDLAAPTHENMKSSSIVNGNIHICICLVEVWMCIFAKAAESTNYVYAQARSQNANLNIIVQTQSRTIIYSNVQRCNSNKNKLVHCIQFTISHLFWVRN